MQLPLLIGLAGGLASAALFIVATINGNAMAGGMDGRVLIYFLAALPAFLAFCATMRMGPYSGRGRSWMARRARRAG